jgi:hypothetical protein
LASRGSMGGAGVAEMSDPNHAAMWFWSEDLGNFDRLMRGGIIETRRIIGLPVKTVKFWSPKLEGAALLFSGLAWGLRE